MVAQDGSVLLDHAGTVDAADPYALIVSDPDLPDGVFTLRWRSVSTADGHSASGFFTFGIGDVGDLMPGSPAGGASEIERDPIVIAGRAVTYVGLMGALGLAVFSRIVVGAGSMRRQLVVLIAAGLGAAALATLVVALLSGLASGDAAAYLSGGRSGRLQVARAVVALAGAAGLLLAPRRAAFQIAAVAGLAGIGLHVAAGHASALGSAAVAAGTVHVAAAVVWAGGVAGLLLLGTRPGWLTEQPLPSWSEIIPRFSGLALVSVGLMGMTGVYSVWAQTGELLPLDSEYGRTLALKTIAAVAAIGIGGANFIDGGRRPGWLGGTRDRLVAEASFIGVVLLLTGSLAITPPSDEQRGVAIRPIPDAFGEVAPGMSMEIGPGRPGVNRITIRTTDALAALRLELSLDRIDDGTSTRVPLVLRGLEGMQPDGMEGMDHSAMAERNRDGTVDWYADATVLPAGSRWDTTVHVLSSDGVELTRQRFAFTLDDDGIDEGRLASALNPGTTLAVILAVGGALAVGLGLGGLRLPRSEAATSRVALVVGGAVALALGTLLTITGLIG